MNERTWEILAESTLARVDLDNYMARNAPGCGIFAGW